MTRQFHQAVKFVQMLAKNSRPDQCAKIKDRVIKYAVRGKIISAYCSYEGDEACPKIDQLVKALDLVGDKWFITPEKEVNRLNIAGLSTVAAVECEPVDDPKWVTFEFQEWDQTDHEDGRGSVDFGKDAGKNFKKTLKTALKFCKKGKHKGRADNVIEKILLKDGYVVACDGVRIIRIAVPALKTTPAILIDRETAEIVAKTDRIIEKITYCKKWVSFHFEGAFKISARLYEYEKYPECEGILNCDKEYLHHIKFDKKLCEAVKAFSKQKGDIYIKAGAVSSKKDRDAPGYASIELDALEKYNGLTRLDAKLLNDILQELKEGTLSLPPAGYFTVYLENNDGVESVLMAKRL